MYARIDSVHKGAGAHLDLRALGALLATLAVGVAAGFLAASLTSPSTSKVVSNAPAAAVAPSTGMYGDHDSRLPIAGGVSAGMYGDHDSRLPIASGAAVSTGSAWGDRDSRLTILNSSDTDLQRGIDANVTALQGLAGVDWSIVQDSQQKPAPFSGRRFK